MKKFFALFIISLCLCVSAFAQDSPLKILDQPKPELPEDYGTLDAQGSIVLRVEFLADGKIGEIKIISSIGKSLTDLAIEAAKKIKYEPEKKDGEVVTVIKTVRYSYSWDGFWKVPPQKLQTLKTEVYYKESDKNLEKVAEISEIPKFDYPTQDIFDKGSGKITIEIVLKSTGEIEILKVDSDLPKDYVEKVKDDLSKLKFNPAIHKNGQRVSQIKVFEYEFKPNK